MDSKYRNFKYMIEICTDKKVTLDQNIFDELQDDELKFLYDFSRDKLDTDIYDIITGKIQDFELDTFANYNNVLRIKVNNVWYDSTMYSEYYDYSHSHDVLCSLSSHDRDKDLIVDVYYNKQVIAVVSVILSKR